MNNIKKNFKFSQLLYYTIYHKSTIEKSIGNTIVPNIVLLKKESEKIKEKKLREVEKKKSNKI